MVRFIKNWWRKVNRPLYTRDLRFIRIDKRHLYRKGMSGDCAKAMQTLAIAFHAGHFK
jgi:hypothetical protein